MVGQPEPGESLIIENALSLFDGLQGKTLRATQGGKTNPSEDIIKYIEMGLETKNIITHRFPLEKINEAFELLKNGKAGRIMIDIGEE
jgi:S-(hydroxymethyl)glutathione dehydrogenase/alcohol dehydrogenase